MKKNIKIINMKNIFRQIPLRFRIMIAFSCIMFTAYAQDTLWVQQQIVPILIERQDNVLMYLRIDAKNSKELDNITIDLPISESLRHIKAVKLYYGGTEARQDASKKRFAPACYITNFTPNRTLFALPSYSVKRDEVAPKNNLVTLKAKQKLFPGVNFFWISIEMKPSSTLNEKIKVGLKEAVIDNSMAILAGDTKANKCYKTAIGVRHAGDDGVAAYRIPGLVTSNKGTLLATYDVRHNNSVDLQEYIEIGLSRSIDKGVSWEPMRIPMSFGENGGLPKAQNGVGDPAILVDEHRGTIWIIGTWAHGMGNQRAWFSSQPGMDKDHTAQLMIVKSEDDGKTWSEPINITKEVKESSSFFLLEGPGRGITMHNGTLVFPMQFIDKNRMPHAGIIYSKDHGKTWKVSNPAKENTTEAQVVELKQGELMLNMRDNRGGSRAIMTTNDMGETWQEHSSSRSALIEPICMASLIKVRAKDNCLGKDILLFSNPNSTKSRNNITVKASLDNGLTWKEANQMLLDEGTSWGYTCLTMVDKETVGILYESSAAQITFETIKLNDLVKEIK